jgi:uncharacterized protein
MVTATDFHTYYQLSECARRLWLAANRPELRAPLSEFDELLLRKGREHEEAQLATFSDYARPSYPKGDLTAGAEATRDLISDGSPVIYQGVLVSPNGDLAGIPDFLIREGAGYAVRDAKLAVNLDQHPEIPAQLGLYAHLLESATGQAPARLEVVLGNGEIIAVDALPIVSEVRALSDIKSSPEQPDDAVGWSKCSSCCFSDHCWTAAVGAHDPAVVPGVSQALRHLLLERGLARYDDLARLSASELADLRLPWGAGERRLGEKAAARVLRQVRVLMSGNLEVVVPPEMPPPGPVVYFDIESNPWDIGMETRVYLWGMLLDRGDGAPPQYWGAVAAGGSEGDEAAWQAFLTHSQGLLNEYADLPFVHYSHYEKTWVSHYVDRHGDRDGAARRLLSSLWDMEKRSVRSRLCLPVHSYGLKHVEKCAGFERSQADHGGLWSVARYHAYLAASEEAERRAIERELLTYNEEDCVAMREVLAWIRGFC